MSFPTSDSRRVKELSGVAPKLLTEELLETEQPLVLRGFALDWPAVVAGRASAQAVGEYLAKFYSGAPLTICRGEANSDGRIFYNGDMTGFNFHSAAEDFMQFVRDIFASEPSDRASLYMPSTSVDHWFPGFDIENSAGLEDLQPARFLWAGNRTRIAAHYDSMDNLAVCIAGRRRFTLFPPEQVTNLYPGPLDFSPGGQEISLVDFAAPNLNLFPKFSAAMEAAQVAELHPGDALILPSMWWHHVEGLEDFNVLYTQWWRKSPRYLGRAANALTHAILSIRSLPEAEREAWQALFNHYIFERDENDIAAIPDHAQTGLALPLDDIAARKLRAELLKRLKAL